MSQHSIGRMEWEAVEVATGAVVSAGEKDVALGDVSIEVIDARNRWQMKVLGFVTNLLCGESHGFMHDKRVKLDDQFAFAYSEAPLSRNMRGLGLHVARTDGVHTFCWEWFNVDRIGHAQKLQESGEIGFERGRTAAGHECTRMIFLTDVSMRVMVYGDEKQLEPRWRVRIFKDSWVAWPSLVEGVVTPS